MSLIYPHLPTKNHPKRFVSSLDFMPQINAIIALIKSHIESTINSYTTSSQRSEKDMSIFNDMMKKYHQRSLAKFETYITLKPKNNQNYWFEKNITQRYNQYIIPNIIKDNAISLEEFDNMIQYLNNKKVSIDEIINTKIREAFILKYLEMMFELYNPNYSFQLYPTSMREDVIYGSDYLLFATDKNQNVTTIPIDLKTTDILIDKLWSSEKDRVKNPQYYFIKKYGKYINIQQHIQRNILVTFETEYNIIKRYLDNLNQEIYNIKETNELFEIALQQKKISISTYQKQLNDKQFDINQWWFNNSTISQPLSQ